MFIFTLSHIPGFSLGPCPCLGCKPKVRVATPFLIGVHCMAHKTNLTIVVLSKLPLVSRIKSMLQFLYSFFAHNFKKLLEFTKFVKTLETKWLNLLKNVKTHWISMLNLLKCLLARYKSLVVKMHSNCVKNIYDHDNFELLCDLDLILGLPCVMPILEVVH